MKLEKEWREAARQARKLEFWISQTEFYRHFDLHDPRPPGADLEDIDLTSLQDINFNDGKS